MTRLLMTADAVGGVWTYACELARALAPHEVATTIATMGPAPTSDQLASAADIPDLEIVSSRFQLEWMDDPWRDVADAGSWLLDLERRIRPALVHLNGYAHASLPFQRPVVVVGHSCVQSWQETTGGRIDAVKLSTYREAVTRGLRAADWVVAPTASMLRSLQRHYGPVRHASVVANGRSADRFAPASKAPLVLAAGRLWDRAKNVEAIVEVAPRLRWPVAVAGFERVAGGKPRPPADAHVMRLGRLSEPQLASWLSRAAIYAHPARYEPFGLLPLEAAMSGCALVLGDIPSLREVWDDAALFVPPDDREALVDAIGQLESSETLRHAFAARARDRARLYTPERMAAGYLSVYECVTGRAFAGAGVTSLDASGSSRRSATDAPRAKAEGLRCAS